MTAIIPRSGSVARRVARPSASKAEQLNSKVAAMTAATSGGNTGTWYSSAKSWTVNSQLAVLVRPAFITLQRHLHQYLRQNWSTCKGFCRFIELLSATTTTQNPQEALYGHFSMFAMPPTHRNEDHVASMQPHCYGDGGHDGACDDVGPVPVGWPRGQLSDSTTLFRDGDTVGHAILGVLSAPCVSVRGGLPARGRRSRRHQSRQEHPWFGSVLCQSVWQTGARAGLLRVILGQHPATALVPGPRRAGRAQRRRKSGQQGQSGSQEVATVHRQAVPWTSKGQ